MSEERTKTCPTCQRELPEAAFGVRTHKRNVKRYLRPYCRECKKARDRAWGEANPEKKLQHRLNYARKRLEKIEQQLAERQRA
jgi:DNA repair exonuclease SbcCD ATPase subunit